MTWRFRASPTNEGGIVHVGPAHWSDDARLVAVVNRSSITAAVYDPLWRGLSTTVLTRGGYSVKRELADMVAWTTAQGRSTILDLGCGSGHYLRALRAHRADLDLVGVDESLAFLRTALRRRSNERVGATWVWGTAMDLPFEDASFDAVACGGTPNEFADPPAALREAYRVTAPGGRGYWMLATRSHRRAHRAARAGRPFGLWLPTVDEALTAIDASGWTIVRGEHRPPLLVVRTRRDA